MTILTELLGAEIEKALLSAIDRKAHQIAAAKLYSGTAAIEAFGITRGSLKHITATWLPGRTKPLYSAGEILQFIETKTVRKR